MAVPLHPVIRRYRQSSTWPQSPFDRHLTGDDAAAASML
jgi:hypothetical protein